MINIIGNLPIWVPDSFILLTDKKFLIFTLVLLSFSFISFSSIYLAAPRTVSASPGKWIMFIVECLRHKIEHD